MYAHRRHYVKRWEHQSEDDRYMVKVERGGKPAPNIDPERISTIEEEVMYWRKANQIHKWFVDNVQEGFDDCKSYYVEEERLQELRDICDKVIEASKLVDGMVQNGTMHSEEYPKGQPILEVGRVIKDATVAQELLPTQDGFFFGHTGYDEEYLNDVTETRDWANRMLLENLMVGGDIYYLSSW